MYQASFHDSRFSSLYAPFFWHPSRNLAAGGGPLRWQACPLFLRPMCTPVSRRQTSGFHEARESNVTKSNIIDHDSKDSCNTNFVPSEHKSHQLCTESIVSGTTSFPNRSSRHSHRVMRHFHISRLKTTRILDHRWGPRMYTSAITRLEYLRHGVRYVFFGGLFRCISISSHTESKSQVKYQHVCTLHECFFFFFCTTIVCCLTGYRILYTSDSPSIP